MLLLNQAFALHLDLKLGTAFPTDLGAQATLEIPARIRFTTAAAWLPGPYLDFINNTSVKAQWYDQVTADLISAALQNSLILRAHIGWRPFKKLGFQFELGYNFIGLGGGLTGEDVLEAATDYNLPAGTGGYFEFSAQAALHRADLTVGWEFVVKKHLLLRLDIGASYTFSANSKLEPEFDVPRIAEDGVEQLTQEGEAYLNDIFTSYVHTPILAFYTGWRF
jgi:hypothetical protein